MTLPADMLAALAEVRQTAAPEIAALSDEELLDWCDLAIIRAIGQMLGEDPNPSMQELRGMLRALVGRDD